MLFRLPCQLHTNLTFHRWGQETLIAILHRLLQESDKRRSLFYRIVPSNTILGLFIRQGNTDTQHPFALSPIESKNAVRNKLGDSFVELVVELIDTVGVLLSNLIRISHVCTHR